MKKKEYVNNEYQRDDEKFIKLVTLAHSYRRDKDQPGDEKYYDDMWRYQNTKKWFNYLYHHLGFQKKDNEYNTNPKSRINKKFLLFIFSKCEILTNLFWIYMLKALHCAAHVIFYYGFNSTHAHAVVFKYVEEHTLIKWINKYLTEDLIIDGNGKIMHKLNYKSITLIIPKMKEKVWYYILITMKMNILMI